MFFDTSPRFGVLIQQFLTAAFASYVILKFAGRRRDCKTICHALPGGSMFAPRCSRPGFVPLTALSGLFVTPLFSDQIGCSPPCGPFLSPVRDKWCRCNLLLLIKLSALWMDARFLLSNFNDRGAAVRRNAALCQPVWANPNVKHRATGRDCNAG